MHFVLVQNSKLKFDTFNLTTVAEDIARKVSINH